MSSINIKTDIVKGLNVRVGQGAVKASDIKNGISLLKYNIDSEILSRRNIRSRITSACHVSSELESRLRSLESFINNSSSNYSTADDYLHRLALSLDSGISSYNKQYNTNPANADMPEENSFWDKLKVGANAVITNAKNAYSTVKQAFEPGGALYKTYQIGKAVVGMGLGIVEVVGSGIGTVFSGGTASPLTVITALYGANEVFNNAFNLYYAITDQYDKIDSVNVLKDGISGFGGYIGKQIGIEKIGRTIGEGIYYIGSFTNIVKGGYDSIKDLKALPKISKVKLVDELKGFKGGAIYTVDKIVDNIVHAKNLKDIKARVIIPIEMLMKINPNITAASKTAKGLYDTGKAGYDIITEGYDAVDDFKDIWEDESEGK